MNMERQYYIASGKDHLGPFSSSDLKERQLKPDTLVWYEGLEQWIKIGEIDELKPEIPLIPYVPPTPLQQKGTENKIRRQIKLKLLMKAAKKAGMLFIPIFIIRYITQYVSFSSGNIIDSLNRINVYAVNKEDAIGIIALSSFGFSLILSIILFVVYYLIEKQKPYDGLLALKDEEDKEVYNQLIKEQSEKYMYDEPLKVRSLYYGYGVLIYNVIFSFFPEVYYFQLSTLSIAAIIITLLTRIVPLFLVVEIRENKKKRNGFLWGLSSLIFPAITLILISSLYPKKQDNDNTNTNKEL